MGQRGGKVTGGAVTSATCPDRLTTVPGFFMSKILNNIAMNHEAMELVFAQINAERANQIAKWGDGQTLTPIEYVPILGEEFGEVCRAVHDAYFAAKYPAIQATPGDYSQYRKELIQLATVCVAAIQNLDKNQQA